MPPQAAEKAAWAGEPPPKTAGAGQAPLRSHPPGGKKKGAGGQTASSFNTSLLTSLLAQTEQRPVTVSGPPAMVDT